MTSERGRDQEQGYPEGRGKKWFPERMSDPPCQRLLKGGGRQRESGMRGVQEAGVTELRKGLRMLSEEEGVRMVPKRLVWTNGWKETPRAHRKSKEGAAGHVWKWRGQFRTGWGEVPLEWH